MKPLVLSADPNRHSTHTLIFLHGLGGSAEGLTSLAQRFSAGSERLLRIVLPQAPLRAMTILGGRKLAGWYDMRDPNDLERHIDTDSIEASVDLVNCLVATERERGRQSHEIFLGGFSQGGVIAYHAGFRSDARLGGLICLSTYFPAAKAILPKSHLAGLPVFAAHGTSDSSGPYWMGKAGAEEARRLGADIRWRSYSMDHTISDLELSDVNAFLSDVTKTDLLISGVRNI